MPRKERRDRIPSVHDFMSRRDFLLLAAICFVWAVNAVVSRYAIADAGVPPLLLSAARFALAAAVLSPLLRPLPRPLAPLIVVSLLMGAGHFGVLMIGYGLVDASVVAILLQVGIPMTALFSALILGERIAARRLVGIVLVLAGIVAVLWRPDARMSGLGAAAVLVAAASLALGSVLMKRLAAISPMRLQAWTSLSSIWPLAAASLAFEPGQAADVLTQPLVFGGTVLFASLAVTVISHTGYYRLLRRYEASLVSPLTLMFPLMTVVLGQVLLGERPDAAFFAGTVLVLAGVALVATSAARPTADNTT